MLTMWPFGSFPLGPHCRGGHRRSFVLIGALARVLVSSSQFEQMGGLLLCGPHQANLQPNLILFSSHLCFNPTPIFLGFTFDCTLSFPKHISSLKAKFFPHLKALCCIFAFSLPPFMESLSVLYKAFYSPLLTYASLGWFPFLSISIINKLECLHQAANHTITSCLSSSLIPVLHSEASLPSLRVTLTHFTVSLHLCTLPLCPLTRSCFLLLFLEKLFLLVPPFPSWNLPSFTVEFTLSSLCSRSDLPLLPK